MKAAIYESLYAINNSLQQVAEHVDKLKDSGLLLPHMADLYRLSAEELSAQISQTITLTLHTREAEEAAQLSNSGPRWKRHCGIARKPQDVKDATAALKSKITKDH